MGRALLVDRPGLERAPQRGPDHRGGRPRARQRARRRVREGADAVWLAQRGWRVTGLDVSGVALARARGWDDEKDVEVEWVRADLTEAGFQPGSFDLVAFFYPPIAAHRRRRRRTAPHGPRGAWRSPARRAPRAAAHRRSPRAPRGRRLRLCHRARFRTPTPHGRVDDRGGRTPTPRHARRRRLPPRRGPGAARASLMR